MKQDLIQKLQKELGIKNFMALPMVSKIVVSMGVRNALSDKKNLERGILILSQITGQKPKVCKAKKSVASFKLREGDEIGLMVTLRGKRMHDFFEKLTTIVLPRLRDFHGINKSSFDGHGNYTIGFGEYTVFPEIDLGKTDAIMAGQGLEVNIVTTAGNDEKGLVLLKTLGMPFRKD